MAHDTVIDARPNGRAWLHVTGWGLLAFAVLAPVVALVDDHHGRVYVVATVLATCAAVAAICGVLAWMSSSRWSWWLYPPIVILPAVAVVALADLVPDRLDNVQRAGNDDRTLAAPATAGTWRLQTSPEIDQRAADLQEQVKRADAGLTTVYGEYRRPGGDLLIYNGLNAGADSVMVDELVKEPKSALTDYLVQTGVVDIAYFDAGGLGGELACGTIPQMGPYVDLPVCGWADAAGIGRATYRVDGINLEAAGELTRDFRGEVTEVG